MSGFHGMSAVVLAMITLAASAQEPVAPEPAVPASEPVPAAETVAAPSPVVVAAPVSPWSGEAALGYLASSGNARSQSLNTKAAVSYEHERWKHQTAVSAISASTEQQQSAEAYTASHQSDWAVSGRAYALLALDWNHDRFAAVREQLSESVGLGRHLLDGPQHRLDLEVGAGARQSQTNDVPRQRRSDLIGRGALDFRWTLSPTSSLHQHLRIETGRSNTYTESLSELKLAVVGNLYAGLSYTLKYNTEVADDTRHSDTYTAVNLSYSFGRSP